MRTEAAIPHDTQNVVRIWNGQSGNCDSSRATINTIVLHTMDGFLNGTTAWFSNPTVNQAAHYGIGQDGKIILWVPENMTAYHSGKYSVNQCAIGIETEDLNKPDEIRPDALYESAIKLVADICKAYNIPADKDHIKKHNEIVSTHCPGSLDVDRIIKGASQLLTPEEPLHTYQMPEKTFIRLVTKSTEYDIVWKSLELDESLKDNPGSSRLIIEAINAKLTEARMIPSNEANTLPQPTINEEKPSDQAVQEDKEQAKNIISQVIDKIIALLNKKIT
jgi:hypothetical protein